MSFESAYALHVAGDLTGAEAAYRHLMEEDPGQMGARHCLGVLLHQKGQSGQGIALILEALERDPGHASRYNDFGNVLAAVGDLDNAVSMFLLSLQVSPGDANVWNNLGAVLYRRKALDEAGQAFRQALACQPGFVPAMTHLANLLTDLGQEEEASLYACQAFLQPPLDGKSSRMLGIACYRLGRIEEAAAHYRQWLELEPGHPVARHLLAACSQQNVPDRAPDDFLVRMFDDMADEFDRKLTEKLDYRGPGIMARSLARVIEPAGRLNVLDAGCGTGLAAPLLKPFARKLVGVDLSSGMLACARKHEEYDALEQAELTDYLAAHPGTFDLVAMVDTLIYFGDLTRVLELTARALTPEGWLGFTVEAVSLDRAPVGYCLDPGGRYRHAPEYLEKVLGESGFVLERMEEVALRSEFCRPAPGLAVLARVGGTASGRMGFSAP